MSELATINTLQSLFDSQREQIANLLPKHISIDRLTRIALSAISKNPTLLKCSQSSLLTSLMDAAKLGLEPSGPLGEGYLVPYYNKETKVFEAQFQPGYRGLVTLARRAGSLKEIDARVVHQNDLFDVVFGIHKDLIHKPEIVGNPGKPIAVYVVFQLEGGGVQFDVMRIEDVNAIRARSKAKDSGPWVTDYEEMAKKTVIKRGLKLVPMSIELAEAIEADNRIEFDVDLDAPKGEEFIEPKEKAPKEKASKKPEPTVVDSPKPQEAASPNELLINAPEREALQLTWNEAVAGTSEAVRNEFASDLKKKYGFKMFGDVKKKDLLSVIEDIQNWEPS